MILNEGLIDLFGVLLLIFFLAGSVVLGKAYLELRRRVLDEQRMDFEDIRRFKRSALVTSLFMAIAFGLAAPIASAPGSQVSVKTTLILSLIFGAIGFLTVQIASRGAIRSFKLWLMVRPLMPDEDSNSEGDDQGVGSGDD